MKQSIANLKHLAVFLCASLVAAPFVNEANAQSKFQKVRYVPEAIRYAGAENEYVMFEVNLEHLPLNQYTLQITDESGTILYEDKLIAGQVYRRYKIDRKDYQRLNFELFNKEYRSRQSFSLSTKVEEKLEVKPIR